MASCGLSATRSSESNGRQPDRRYTRLCGGGKRWREPAEKRARFASDRLQETERALAAAGNYAAAFKAAVAASARFPGEVWLLLDCIDFATKLGDYAEASKRIVGFAGAKGLLDYGKPLARSLEELIKFRIDAVTGKLAEKGRFAEGFAFLDGLKKVLPGALYVDERRGVLFFHEGRKEEGIALVDAVYAAWIKGHPEFTEPIAVELPIRGTTLVWGNARKDAVTHAGMSRFCFDFLGADEAGSLMLPGKEAPGKNEDYLGFGRDVLSAAAWKPVKEGVPATGEIIRK